MTEKARPAQPRRVSQKPRKESNCLKYNTKSPARQVPIPGTALAALLKRYRRDLLDSEPSRQNSAALDCVDYLLDLVGVRP